MISPEIFRRYPFFSELDADKLKQISMISEELSFPSNSIIFQEGKSAEALFILVEGSIDLLFEIDYEKPKKNKKIVIGEINPGEPFGISALIEPYLHTSTARTALECKVIKIQAEQLRNLCQSDNKIACCLMREVAKSALHRLATTRIQLAAAYA